MQTLPLELKEKAEFFKILIQPLVQLIAQVYQQSQKVFTTLNLIYR